MNDKLSSVEYGKEILNMEAQAISCLADTLDENFAHAINLILEMASEGRVVSSGMGKAGFIAQKISATLASTGIPSFFLHPAEAVHGDLGRYSKKDIALILSNSGETNEILRIVPVIKRMGCPIISITGNPNSRLAQHSDVALSIGKQTEAGPLGLAPTTSTTLMLALGDALSMAILQKQNFSREQFATYHPGGKLGQVLLSVSEIMRKDDENCVVERNTLTRDVLHQITTTKGRPGATSIVNETGVLVGVFTDGNLRRCLEQGASFLEQPISDIMTPNPKTIQDDQLVQKALHLMTSYKIDQIIVVDKQNRPIGMIDIQDLIEFK